MIATGATPHVAEMRPELPIGRALESHLLSMPSCTKAIAEIKLKFFNSLGVLQQKGYKR